MRLFLIFLIVLSLSVSRQAYAQDRLRMDELQSTYQLFLGKLLYHRFGNYDGAETHFKKVNGKQKKEAYVELGSLYLERSYKEAKPENQLIYQRKAIDAFGRFLASADSRDKHDALRYAQIKGFKQGLEAQITASIASRTFGSYSNRYSRESESEFAKGTHSLRESPFKESIGGLGESLMVNPSGRLREPLRMNSGESKGFSLTERGDTFHREEPFRINIGTIKGSSSTSKGGGGGYTPGLVRYFNGQGQQIQPQVTEMSVQQYLSSPLGKREPLLPGTPSPIAVTFTERGTVEVRTDPSDKGYANAGGTGGK